MCQTCTKRGKKEKKDPVDVEWPRQGARYRRDGVALNLIAASMRPDRRKHERGSRREKKTGRRCRREKQGIPTISSYEVHCFTVGAHVRASSRVFYYLEKTRHVSKTKRKLVCNKSKGAWLTAQKKKKPFQIIKKIDLIQVFRTECTRHLPHFYRTS